MHDELLLEVPDTELSGVKELVRAEMVGAYPLDPPLAVEVGVRRQLGRRQVGVLRPRASGQRALSMWFVCATAGNERS